MEETGANVIIKSQQPGQIAHLPWSHPMLIPILFPLLTPHSPFGYLRAIPLAKTAAQRADNQLHLQNHEIDLESNEEAYEENIDGGSMSETGNLLHISFLFSDILRNRK